VAIPRVLDAAWAGSLDVVLSGRAGWQAVRDIATEPWRGGVDPLLERCGLGSARDLVLTRTKYKPGRKLTAHYRLLTTPDGPASDITVRWHAAPVATTPATTESQAGDRHSVLLMAASDDGHVALLVSPADPSMPQLERLHRPAHLAGVLASIGAHDPVETSALAIETIRYRPGERHVLHVSTAGRSSALFVKTDRDGSGARAVPIATAVAAALARSCPDVGVAEPLGYAEDDAAAVWRRADGDPLSRRLAEGRGSEAELFRLLGRALRAVHDKTVGHLSSPVGAALGGTPRTGQAEVAATLRAGEHIRALLPAAGRASDALVADVARELDQVGLEPPTLIHGDLKCDNVMTAGDRLDLLDFDRAGLGDPALDLGKIVADLRWWHADGIRSADGPIEAFRDGYGPCDGTRWERAWALAVLFQLKFAARRAAVHDVWWPHRVRARIEDATRAFDRRGATR
jgi:aminoglycoside phosphotransferase (APT) family kinase protein